MVPITGIFNPPQDLGVADGRYWIYFERARGAVMSNWQGTAIRVRVRNSPTKVSSRATSNPYLFDVPQEYERQSYN